MSILIVICGATATGKSGLAIALAHKLNAVILSADSRQIYREFNIGTAKPSIVEQQQAPHYLIDICDPTETLTLADYQEQAQSLIQKIHAARSLPVQSEMPRRERQPIALRDGLLDAADNRSIAGAYHAMPLRDRSLNPQFPIPNPQSPFPLLVGGTGLYIRSIVRGLQIPKVAPQPQLRSQLAQLGQAHCYDLLKQVDPASAEKISPNDQVRTLRALEVYYVTGVAISAQQGETPPNYPILQIGLDCRSVENRHLEADPLTCRIAQRTQQMVADGFVEEVDRLSQKYGADLPLLNTLGYQEIGQYLRGEISLSEAIDLTTLHTRQFAKRQRTWFRADPTIEWFDSNDPQLVDRVWARIQAFLEATHTNTKVSIEPSIAQMNIITITVKLFAAYQEAYQQSELSLQFPEGTTVEGVRDRLVSEHPELEQWRNLTRFGVNLQFVEPNTVLQNGDEVVLIPPVSGG